MDGQSFGRDGVDNFGDDRGGGKVGIVMVLIRRREGWQRMGISFQNLEKIPETTPCLCISIHVIMYIIRSKMVILADQTRTHVRKMDIIYIFSKILQVPVRENICLG